MTRKEQIENAVDTFLESVAATIERRIEKSELTEGQAAKALEGFQELGDLRDTFVAVLLEFPETMLAELNRGLFSKSAQDVPFPSLAQLVDRLPSED